METPTTNKNKSLKENWKKAAAMAGAAMAGAGAVAAADVLREDEEAEDVKPTTEEQTATQDVAQNQPTSTTEAPTDHVEVINVEETPDIDPSLVAQDLTDDDAILVTPNDLEAEHIDLAATDTVETVDGETIQATPIADDSAEPVYMVDINNGDNTHTDDLACANDPADDLMGTNDPADADLYLSPSDDAFIS